MELVGSLFLILAVALLVAMFVSRPFFNRASNAPLTITNAEQQREHLRSSLLAERDRVLNALQELDFDFALGKVPAEDYPEQRAVLLRSGADVLRRLDELQPGAVLKTPGSVEDQIEAAVAARRADSSKKAQALQPKLVSTAVESQGSGNGTNGKPAGQDTARKDAIEDIIANRKRDRKESSAGFCPSCGRPVQKSDKFCSRCGTTL